MNNPESVNPPSGSRARQGWWKWSPLGLVIILSYNGRLVWNHISAARVRANNIICTHRLKQIALAGVIYAESHGGRFPETFAQMGQELGPVQKLVCPLDPANPIRNAPDWDQADVSMSDYELYSVSGVVKRESPLAFVRCKRHETVADTAAQIVDSR